MHYHVNNFIIESELAAKPIGQTNKYVLDYINHLPHESKILDYGCGKLRYSIILARNVTMVVGIDSSYQLEKKQIINGIKTTVNEYGNSFQNNLSVYCLESEKWKTKKYDIVFCTNVLSAIPYDEIRLEVLSNAKSVLDNNAYVFITVQYRNSYFSKYALRFNAIRYHDGWLLPRSNGKYSFYGLVTVEKVIDLCNKAGLETFDTIHHEGSLFIKAR